MSSVLSRIIGSVHLDTLVVRCGARAGVRVIVPAMIVDCPQREPAALMERCGILFPELLALFPAH